MLALAAGLVAPPAAYGQTDSPTATSTASPTPTATPTAGATAASSEESGGGSAAAIVIAMLVGAALGAGAMRAWLGRRVDAPAAPAPQRPRTEGRAAAVPQPPGAAAGAGGCQNLVRECIEVADQVGSAMLREKLHKGLKSAGVLPIRADGEHFNPKRHHAVGSAPTRDAASDGLVADTPRIGWQDGERAVRKPDVLVYRYTETSSAEP
jgi:GrpE